MQKPDDDSSSPPPFPIPGVPPAVPEADLSAPDPIEAVPGRDRISAVGPAPRAVPVSEAAGAALETRGLTRRFGRFVAVDGIDLRVPAGSVYGFLGRNGAGKTTTIRLLMGIIRPTRGEIHFGGRRMKRRRIRLKQQIGYVSQHQHCYPWMNADQLGRFASGFYPTWDMAEYRRLVERFDVPLDRRFSRLSGGMQVKLGLALALAHRPPLLILDEPTSSLDPVARREFLDLIAEQALDGGRTTFFSSHRIDEVERIADHLGIIQSGRLVYQGRLDALTASVRRLTALQPVPPPAAADAGPAVSAGPPPLPPPGEPAAGVGPIPPLPAGIEILCREHPGPGGDPSRAHFLARADPGTWDRFNDPAWAAESLPLEDIFIAVATARTADLAPHS